MTEKKSFVLYTDYYEYIKELDNEQVFNLLNNIFRHELGEKLLDMDAITRLVFSFICNQLERDREKWEKTVEKRSKAGKASAKARKNQHMSTHVNTCQHMSTHEGDNVNVNVNVNDNDNDTCNMLNVNDNESVNDNDSVSVNENVALNTHGEYHHVLLSDQDFNSLVNEYGEEKTFKAIKFLDEYIQEKDYSSNDHYLTLKRWVFDAVTEQEQRKENLVDKNSDEFWEKL